ncbi:hypothetical protein [Nonomuraea basaltis]|uniref:hypothetical protein n=1 Tax=Nonomuraea basaltis TaxID=2495887 RepID=UPI00110C5486|nr:hypothetical protein [Nonomuraea basaltis]TMR89168.1 hypothetical protein EJK15_62190 [Nonomuraea basaltis]
MVAGLLLPPLIVAGLWFGIGELRLQAEAAFQISWLAVGLLAASGIALAFLAGSRLSPIASLLGGLSFTGLGVVPLVEMMGVRVLPENLLPNSLENGYLTLGYTGIQLFLGVALLVVSAFPSRWRARVEPAAYTSAYGPAPSPYLPQTGPEDATRPMYRE